MSWMILADSSCELRSLPNAAPDTGFSTIALKIRVGEREFTDNAALDVASMMTEMRNYNGPSTTSCPSPEEWAEKFLMADKIIAISISSNLSGCYNSALIARDMVLENHPEKQIYVMDSLSTGSQMTLAILKVNELIAQGLSFDEVVKELEVYYATTQVLFTLSCFDNLVKNGRLNRVVGFVAGKMGMRIVGCGSEEGRLEMLHKSRGESRTLAVLLEEMDHRGYNGTPVIISHCFNEASANLLKNGIEKKWAGAQVSIIPCSGITSFYAQEGGIIVGF